MSELGTTLQAFGRTLVERFGALEVWTAVLLAAALVIDHALARRSRASWRIALYAPVALRVIVPLGWNVRLAGMPHLDTFVAPLASIRGGAAVEAVAWHVPLLHVLVGVGYLAVAAVLAGRAIRARVRLGRQLATARLVADVGVDAPCAVLVHEELGPMAVGLVSPRIVLPSRLLAAGEEELLACVLRHEVAHLRRRDAWLLAAMQALAIVAWPIVPMWLAVARVRHLVELACDEAALRDADAAERVRYGQALLDLASRPMFVVAPLGAGELHFGSTLRARIEALATQPHWPLALQRVVLSVAPVALLVACSASPPASATAREKWDDPRDHSKDAQGYGYVFETDSPPIAARNPSWNSRVVLNPDGRLSAETIQAVVRQHFARFSTCYHAGLQGDAKLAGTVTVKSVFGQDGVVRDVEDEGSTLPDKQVVGCVVDEFRKITYPREDHGEVTLIYPIDFSP